MKTRSAFTSHAELDELATLSMPNRALAQRLHDWRHFDARISLAEAAWRLGISRAYLHDIEQGRVRQTSITFEALKALMGDHFERVILSREYEDQDWSAWDIDIRRARIAIREINLKLSQRPKRPRHLLRPDNRLMSTELKRGGEIMSTQGQKKLKDYIAGKNDALHRSDKKYYGEKSDTSDNSLKGSSETERRHQEKLAKVAGLTTEDLERLKSLFPAHSER